MSYLYGEIEHEAERRALRGHLAECAECRTQVDSWESTRHQLDTWALRPRQAVASPRRVWVPLAAAAVVFLAIGLALGRYAVAPAPNLEALRNELRHEIDAAASELANSLQQGNREEVRAWLAEYARLQEERRQEDLAALTVALGEIEAQHTSDCSSLRRDLETVAVLTDASFRQTQDRMVQLASLPPRQSVTNTD